LYIDDVADEDAFDRETDNGNLSCGYEFENFGIGFVNFEIF